MLRQRIYIPKYDWEVTVFYESDYRDAPYILRELDEMGVDEYSYIKANGNLRSGRKDTGLTFSNMEERKSLMVLSEASSKEEFANTWIHELIHLAMHLAKANGLDHMGEPIAYLGGEIARSMQPIAARLMCPTCG